MGFNSLLNNADMFWAHFFVLFCFFAPGLLQSIEMNFCQANMETLNVGALQWKAMVRGSILKQRRMDSR